MGAFVYVFANFVYLLLTVLEFMMLFRAIMSWMPIDEDSKLYSFIFAATEPIIIPVRMLLDKIPGANSSPLDLSFFITVLLLSVVQLALPTIYVGSIW